MIREHYLDAFRHYKDSDLHLDFRIITPNGETRWIGHNCLAVYDDHGKWMGRRESNRNITARKMAETELRYMQKGLEDANRELKYALEREKQLSRTDALTGVNNRRNLFEMTEHELEVTTRYNHPLAVAMIDIDHFKQVNDTYGHLAGDHILERVAHVALAELRAADIIGRYGGEEFIIVMPVTNSQQAGQLAERIRQQVEQTHIQTARGETSVTLSIGITERNPAASETVEEMFRRADQAMYAAKQAGRNRVHIGE
jgi:diguanylate cyclase (GGDEF)-like protein